MITRYGTKVTPLESTGEGWMKVETIDGRIREWHIYEMEIEGDESEQEKAIIDQAQKGV